ncbi:hypothetical protein H6503_04480 [Candidatus Woesearchaeota archaeon]|nr:hypothetical protein [Candidatus Woesearchaeota archaeon]
MARKTVHSKDNIDAVIASGIEPNVTGAAIVEALVSVYKSGRASYLSNNLKRYSRLEKTALQNRLYNLAEGNIDADNLMIDEKDIELLNQSQQISTIQYLIHVPMFLSSTGMDIADISRYVGEKAHGGLTHYGSKKVDPLDPKSPYSMWREFLREELQKDFNYIFEPARIH